jgi:tRNA pseudouridine13 synthase
MDGLVRSSVVFVPSSTLRRIHFCASSSIGMSIGFASRQSGSVKNSSLYPLPNTVADVFCSFSDFIVNEIDERGTTLRLTTTKPELLEVPEIKEAAEPAATSSEAPSDIAEEKSAQARFEELMAKEGGDATAAKELLEFATRSLAILSDQSDEGKSKAKLLAKEEIFVPYGEKTKPWRGEFHQLVRQYFPHLRSETSTKSSTPQMRVWCGTDKYDAKKARASQPGRYLKFVLYKENKDSTEAIFLVSKLLGLKQGQVRFAGTKDKRGVTTQAITVPFVEAKRATGINAKLMGLRIGNFSAVNKHLGLGDLKGNHFQVILRDIQLRPNAHFPGKPPSEGSMVAEIEDTPENTISAIYETCTRFAASGFINYYGMQRFGTGLVRTHAVGLECLRGDWKKVVELILKPRGGERQDATLAREHFAKTGSASDTLKMLPRFMLNERQVLQGLADNPNDFKAAFLRLARPMRLMYPHAYQSYIFNMAASRRIELYGYKVVVGDLVTLDVSSLNQQDEDVSALETEAIGDTADEKSSKASNLANVRIVQTEAEAETFSMSQVVLPLPGAKIVLPTNEIGTYIKALLEQDGLDLTFKNDREFHLDGDYRPLIVRPSDFSFNAIRYNNPDGELVQTEEEALLQEQGRGPKALDAVSDGARVALHLQFSLPSSAYASCLVRELVKQPLDQGFLRETLAPKAPVNGSS